MKFKSRIRTLEHEINGQRNELKKTNQGEEKARKKWAKGYGGFLKAVEQITKIKTHGTKKEANLKEKIQGWSAKSTELTKERDAFRRHAKDIQEVLIRLGTERTMLMEQQTNDVKAIDEIVTQVFALNATVVRASQDREDCLNRHVFPRLVDERGRLSSQISFTSADGLRRVVAMVNSMTIVRGDMASQAMSEIQRFFERFQKTTSMNVNMRALYELTKQLLIEKTSFKVGPDLYRFLAMSLDSEVLPELSLAQRLLRQSIRSEKTNSYIRIYERLSQTDKWTVVPQS
ncbi:MAG: hypothetical protein PHF79_01365 [Candidatus Pacebacteria bacterium]|nr:hypothetical protein [Candidatus Paceibacterota bacterium]